MIILNGTIEHITFQNDENHYTIARLKVRETKKTIVIVGHMAGVGNGETLSLRGRWVNHHKYGDQFKVETFEVILPATLSGIRKYLASGIIKGIGKGMAGKIVKHFKEQSLEIIENEPERLLEVEGIGRSKLNQISNAWDKHHSIRKIMKFLQDNGAGVDHAAAILNFYGTDALKILKKKPYSISRDIPEAGFEVADSIALNSGIKQDDPERIKASIIYLLLRQERDGHVYACKFRLIQSCIQLTSAESKSIEAALSQLSKSREIVIEKTAGDCPEEEHSDAVYLRRLHRAEIGITFKIKAMLSISTPEYNMDEEAITREVLTKLALKLSGEQIDIVHQVLSHRVVVITGGPGTGKTTLIRTLCALFQKLRQKVLLCAPTGRAARRLSEVTDKNARTLHKLLLYDPETEIFGRNPENPLETDVVIVDETSMVDTLLMFHLTQAVPVNSVLILVGDIFQLPSVGPGNVLADIIHSGAVKTFALTRIFRQAEKSPIIMNAHAIRKGKMPVLKPDPGNQGLSEFYFIENHAPEKVVQTIMELCSGRIHKAFSHVDEIQVLTPMHKGEAGTINLNQRLQEIINKRPGGIESRGILFKTGDKVMHLKNNYKKEVFNGDIGIIHEVIKSENRLTVDYDGRLIDYDILELDELTLAYAISVHKSQGSEYSAVVIALTTKHFPLLQRNLLYTAMTRGKDLVILVGSSRAVEIALNNNRTDLRLSGLKQRLSS